MSRKVQSSGKQPTLSHYFSTLSSPSKPNAKNDAPGKVSPPTIHKAAKRKVIEDADVLPEDQAIVDAQPRKRGPVAEKVGREFQDLVESQYSVCDERHGQIGDVSKEDGQVKHAESIHIETYMSHGVKSGLCDEKVVLTTKAKTLEDPFFNKVTTDARRHEKFVKKLSDSSHTGNKQDKEQKIGPKGKVAYTPLEQQYIDIRNKNPTLTLFVECGYKYRLFGEDAENAARILNIMCFMDHNFMTASVPTVRVHIHIRRMVEAGYKVGIVRQTETAALKAAGSNKSAPFTRKLHAVYSKATVMDEDLMDIAGVSVDDVPSSSSIDSLQNYIMTVSEKCEKHTTACLVAVDTSTGNMVYDVFEDDTLRSQLESRILQLQPSEVLLPSSGLSRQTEKIIDELCDSCGSYRTERLPTVNFDTKRGIDRLTKLVPEHGLQEIPNRDLIYACIAGLIDYLQEYGLEKVFSMIQNIKHFSTTSSMVLPGNSLLNLEILANADSKVYHGSLFWLLNHTKTKFGARMLKSWITHPVVNLGELEKRLQGVEYFASDATPSVQSSLDVLLSSLPDLERGLQRIHYGKCKPGEFFGILRAFDKIRVWVSRFSMISSEAEIFEEILSNFPSIEDLVAPFAAHLNWSGDGDISEIFRDSPSHPNIKKLFDNIELLVVGLEQHLADIRKLLKMPSLQYTTVLSTKYMIEVGIKDKKSIPSDWISVGGTTKVARYHSPFVADSLVKMAQYQEKLAIESDKAWDGLVRNFGSNYKILREIISRIAVIDCLKSLSVVAKQPGYCKPTFSREDGFLAIEDGRHPLVEATSSTPYVPNSVVFSREDAENQVAVILTGPNMGGKSSFIRMISLLVIMAQIGSYVPAQSMKLSIFDAVYTRMGARDDINRGLSTFMVELMEASEIIKKASSKSLVILDELGRGTSTHDGTAIAYATLEHLVADIKCTTLFVTHYPIIAEIEQVYKSARNLHMSYLEEESAHTSDGRDFIGSKITFLYKAAKGHAERSYGLNVARIAGLPESIIQTASKQAEAFESSSKALRRSQQKADIAREISTFAFGPHESASEVMGHLVVLQERARNV